MVEGMLSTRTKRWIALWVLVCSVVALPSAAWALEPVIVDENTTHFLDGVKHPCYIIKNHISCRKLFASDPDSNASDFRVRPRPFPSAKRLAL